MAKEQIPYTRPYEREKLEGEIFREDGEEVYRKNRRKGEALNAFKKEARAAFRELFKKEIIAGDEDFGSDVTDANEAFKSQEKGGPQRGASVAKKVKPAKELTDEEKKRNREAEEEETSQTVDGEDTSSTSYPGVTQEDQGEESEPTTTNTSDVSPEPPPVTYSKADKALGRDEKNDDKSKRSSDDNEVSGPPFPV